MALHSLVNGTVKALALAASFAFFAGCSEPHSPGANVLLVTLDTTRADHLGSYGYPRATSPNLDELARHSVLYERAYSTSSWTLPAHASLFTGKFPATHGVRHDREGSLILADAIGAVPPTIRARPLRGDEETLAQVLHRAGYATGAVVGGPWLMQPFGFARGFDFYDDSGILNARGRPAANVTDSALTWLTGRDARPFFLFLNYFDPHVPYAPPASHRHSFLPPNVRPDPKLKAQAVDLYDAEILYMDSEFGRLLDHLRHEGLYDDTLIVVTADHGELLGEHDEWGHERFLWEPLVRIPLILKPAGPPIAGRRERERVQLVDVLPMILGRLGLPIPDAVQGGEGAQRLVLAEVNPISESGNTGDWRAQWEGSYKFLRSSLGERHLFDLEKDPAEARDLVASHPEIARRAEQRLQDAFDALPQPAGDSASVLVDQATREALEQLGYLE